MNSLRKEYITSVLNMRTPDEFIQTKGSGYYAQKYIDGTNALDWLDMATDGKYNCEVIHNEHQIYEIPWKNSKLEGDEGKVLLLIAQATVRIHIPELDLTKDGLGSNYTFIEPGSPKSRTDPTPRSIIDCNVKTINSIDTTIKGAETDAFKRALRKFGPSKDLYPTCDINSNPEILPFLALNELRKLLGMSKNELLNTINTLTKLDVNEENIVKDSKIARKALKAMQVAYLKSTEVQL